MINSLKSRMIVELLLFLLVMNISFSNQKKNNFTLKISLNGTKLESLYIDSNDINDEENKKCNQWIPSLMNPVVLVPTGFSIKGLDSLTREEIMIAPPFLFVEDAFKVFFYNFTLFEYNLILAKANFGDIINDCYFGLSSGLSEYENLKNNDINLNFLNNSFQITKQIFSFSNWTIIDKEIISYFYFGEENKIFNSNDGIIGSCDTDNDDPFWGCNFTSISFNNKSIELKNEDDINYKIYFSSENHYIIIPELFKTQFDLITDSSCKEEDSEGLTCDKFFNDNKTFEEIKLIYEDKMNITIEIDNVNRYFIENEENDKKTRIKFGKDYFIFPLIMFKNFHIQFDAENSKIHFYTTNSSILEVKKDKKKDNDKKGSSKAGTVFLVIFIILLVIVLGYAIFCFIKRRRNSIERNINKYNKFEDEEDFKDMNEKRVF